MSSPRPSTIVTAILHVFLLVGAFFTAKVPFGASLAAVSTIFTFILFVPSAVILVKWVGMRRGCIILGVLGLVAIVIESLAIKTGFPYGRFLYNAKTGIMLAGTVPLSTPFAWIGIVLGSSMLSSALTSNWWGRVGITAATMVWLDLLLDPVAVSLNLWHWVQGGAYYGVPLVNYFGWVLSATVGSLLVHLLLRKSVANQAQFPTGLLYSLYYSMLFWLGIAFFNGLFIPLMFGILLLVMYRTSFKAVLK